MVRQALLALLRAGPKYGYQLKTEFEVATGAAWALNIGQVYTTLIRMERDGAVTALGADDDGRQLYQLTASGRDELDQWLDRAVERSTSTRDELVMKVLMARATGVIPAEQIIGTQRAASVLLLQQATAARNDASSLADRLHLERLIVLTNAELRWLDIAEDALSGAEPPPGEPVTASGNVAADPPTPVVASRRGGGNGRQPRRPRREE